MALASMILLAACQSVAPSRPNIVLIVTDDQGYGDFGFMGNPVVQTPEIDKMAARSASLERFYVSPVCAPTRASLMTGRYTYRTRAIDTYLGRAMMEPAETTIAELLSKAGYATGIFGKWHLGDNYPMRPQDQGFQEVLVHRGGGIGQPSDPPGGEGKYTDPILFRNGVQTPMKGYCTDIYFDAAMDFLVANYKQGKPAFVYIPTNAPHGPFHDVPEDLRRMYLGMDLRPTFAAGVTDEEYETLRDRTARILAMITNIDQNVGRLFERLDEIGSTDHTLVLLMVDNGPNGPRYVGRLRGRKSQVNEGGIRSPLLVHWPARLKPVHSSERIAAHIDILPTVLDAAGIELPAGLHIDGRSLLPTLEGQPADWPERTIFIQAHRGDEPERYRNFAAVSQRWKILSGNHFGNQPDDPPRFQLFDVEADPGERNDLAAEHPEIVARLKADYDAWFDDVSSTRPDNYAPPRIIVGTAHENPTVLTRQDWRQLSEGDGWAPDALGNWLLTVASESQYEIRCLFDPEESAGTLELRVASFEDKVQLKPGAKEYTFPAATLAAGDTPLDAILTCNGKVKGVHQVYLTKR
jgi:arylsulfatase/arylsulfatase A